MADDDTDALTDEIIAQSNTTADGIFDRLMEEVQDLDEDEGDEGAIYYSLWVSLTQLLAGGGWTIEELSSDVAHHVNAVTSEGSA
jgi:hypothetical protein